MKCAILGQIKLKLILGGLITDRNSREYELCVCKHITRGQVEDFVKENNSTDFKEVCAQMNIGGVCGACRGMIMEIVEEAMAANK